MLIKFINIWKRLSFKKFKRSKFLFITDTQNESYPLSNTQYLCIRKIYIYYILLSIFKFTNIKKNYFVTIIKDIKPNKIISNNLNIIAYRFKLYSPEIYFYVYQHSYIYDFEINEYKKLYKNIVIDKFFVFDERHKKIFQDIVKSKYLIIGSFRNNFINLKRDSVRKQLNYISEYRGSKQSKNSINCERYIIKMLAKYCNENKYKLLISLNSNRIDKNFSRKKEIKYFKKLSNNNLFNHKSSFVNSSESIITFTMSSNIGVELLAQKIYTIYFDILSISDEKFKNPYFINKSEFFIPSKINYKEIERKFNKLIDEIYYSNNVNTIPYFIKFDKGNSIFKNELYLDIP